MKFYTSKFSMRTCFNFLFCKRCIWARNFRSWRGSSMPAASEPESESASWMQDFSSLSQREIISFQSMTSINSIVLLIYSVLIITVTLHLISHCLNDFAVTFWSFGRIFVIVPIDIKEFVECASGFVRDDPLSLHDFYGSHQTSLRLAKQRKCLTGYLMWQKKKKIHVVDRLI